MVTKPFYIYYKMDYWIKTYIKALKRVKDTNGFTTDLRAIHSHPTRLRREMLTRGHITLDSVLRGQRSELTPKGDQAISLLSTIEQMSDFSISLFRLVDVLRVVYNKENLAIRDLAKFSDSSTSTFHRYFQKLKELGLIVKNNPRKNVTNYELSEIGTKVFLTLIEVK